MELALVAFWNDRFTAAAAGLAPLQSLRCPGSLGGRTVPGPADLRVPARGQEGWKRCLLGYLFIFEFLQVPLTLEEGGRGLNAQAHSPRPGPDNSIPILFVFRSLSQFPLTSMRKG